MGLFDKKYCDICGEKIGLLGNRKLADGNLCSKCARKLSPFFEDRRRSTVADIERQLAYRKDNEGIVAKFEPARVLGNSTKLYIDEKKNQWLVSDSRSWRDENPDVLSLSQVTGCEIDIDKDTVELKRTNREGESVSYIPPRFQHFFDFTVIIHVNHDWFDEIRIKLNGYHDIEGQNSGEYHQTMRLANDIKTALTAARNMERRAQAAASAPKRSVVCPACGATTTPDSSGCCEYCGSPVGR